MEIWKTHQNNWIFKTKFKYCKYVNVFKSFFQFTFLDSYEKKIFKKL